MDTDKTNKLNKSSTVGKAFLILEQMASSQKPFSVSELSERTGFDKTTTYRLLMTLVDLGYVYRKNSSRDFQLGYKVISLGRNLLKENEVSDIINKALKTLSDITKETIHYAILDGNETVVIQKYKGSHLVNVDFQIGDRSPLSYTSIGKVITAYQDRNFIENIISAGLLKIAENTIDTPEKFMTELQKIRQQGYAIDDHEYSNDMRCIAVPIFEHGRNVRSGISISGPDSRFTLTKLQEFSIPMLKIARDLSENLGGNPW